MSDYIGAVIGTEILLLIFVIVNCLVNRWSDFIVFAWMQIAVPFIAFLVKLIMNLEREQRKEIKR